MGMNYGIDSKCVYVPFRRRQEMKMADLKKVIFPC